MPDRKRRNTKITKYRRPLHINIGVVVFGAIFVYIVVSIILYLTSPHITPYEVRQGQLTKNNTYTGLALREETVMYADKSGYVTYYAIDSERVSKGSNIYTLDETGKVQDALKQSSAEETELSDADLRELQLSMENFIRVFDDNNFDEVYDFKNTLDNRVLELLNDNLTASLEEISDSTDAANFDIVKAPEPGIVVLSVDGMEDLEAEQITSDLFDESLYEKSNVKENELVSAGDPVYKLITSENWSIVIEVDDETAETLANKDSQTVQIRFVKDQAEADVSYDLIYTDGSCFAQLHLSTSMIRFASSRYLEIELLLDNKTGLKILVSSIVEKDFYLVPTEYVFQSGDAGSYGVMVERTDDNGNTSMEFLETTLYNEETDEDGNVIEYYIDSNVLSKGDILVQQDSNERFTVGKKDVLTGVYNINKGYAVFKLVNILYENSEYCIVEEGTSYGLATYDHIVLDGSTVEEDEIVY